MCGVYGFVSKEELDIEITLRSIKNMEERGYDSAGLVFGHDSQCFPYKISEDEKPGFTIDDLRKKIENIRQCSIALGHTRWATNGNGNTINAHPHCDSEEKLWIVHNGIVENFEELKKLCKKDLYSETDTEVIISLIAQTYELNKDLPEAVKIIMRRIEGANAILIMEQSNQSRLIAANNGSSVLLGKNETSVFIASSPRVFDNLSITQRHPLKSNEIAIISNEGWKISSLLKKVVDKTFLPPKKLLGHTHHMREEILSQPEILSSSLKGRLIMDKGLPQLDMVKTLAKELRNAKTFHFVGCGTSYHACQYAFLLLSRFGVSARYWIASEFCYSHPVFNSRDVFILISQSGETGDVIEVLDELNTKGNPCLGIVNISGSKIERETNAGIHIRSGIEIGVAATKTFTAQLVSIALLALFLARQRKMTIDTGQNILKELLSLPEKVARIFDQEKLIKQLAKKYANYSNFYFLGRYFNLISAEEGALKLKEVSYIHAEGYPLGEMKHGPLALIDKDFCSVVIIPKDSVFLKSLVNVREIKGRKGPVLAITTEGTEIDLVDDIIQIPSTLEIFSPVLASVPLQMFAYYVALELGRNPDKPRNIAKTLTTI
jgi:glucosamine--fructose-6-phosphate aminotransferase (isomerizing)